MTPVNHPSRCPRCRGIHPGQICPLESVLKFKSQGSKAQSHRGLELKKAGACRECQVPIYMGRAHHFRDGTAACFGCWDGRERRFWDAYFLRYPDKGNDDDLNAIRERYLDPLGKRVPMRKKKRS